MCLSLSLSGLEKQLDPTSKFKKQPLSIRHSWTLPSISRRSKYLLCHGFVRSNSHRYVMDDIIHLFADYYCPDSFTIDDIKHAKCKSKFITPIFILKSLKIYLQIYPNGYGPVTEGNIIIFACLAAFPPQISKLMTKCKLMRAVTFSASNHYSRIKDKITLTFLCR